MSRPALFLDLDGTVRDTLSGRVHPLEPRDQRLQPGVVARLRDYRQRGYAIVGVTNQGAVGLGWLTEAEVEEINQHLMDELAPGLFDLILYSPYHPRARTGRHGDHEHRRKPNPGMAYEARDQLDLDLATSLMVGDMETDRQFARNAGIGTFIWAHEFFRDVPLPAKDATAGNQSS